MYLAGKKVSNNSLTIEILLQFNVILMSYRFECGLCSSVASAQLRLHPKKTQDRLIRLLAIVRLKWSEQGLMFLNQMRGFKAKDSKKNFKSFPPPKKHAAHPLNHPHAILRFINTVPYFLRRISEENIIKRKLQSSQVAVNMN